MENLENKVVESTLEAASGQACPIKKALPVVLPFVLVAGLGLIVVRFVKNRKAKKAAEAAATEEVNPEV